MVHNSFAFVGKVKKLLCEYDAVPSVSEVQWIKDGDVIARNSSLLSKSNTVAYKSKYLSRCWKLHLPCY